MSEVPPYIVFDVETEENGRGSTEFYRPMFRVSSAAFSWMEGDQVKSKFVRGENAVYYFLQRIVKAGIPLVAHNSQFELGVVKCRFPDLYPQLKMLADTMRLAQCYDNGGDEFALETLPPTSLDQQLEVLESGGTEEAPKSLAGLSLTKCVQRILRRPNHKEEAHRWIKANVPECKGKKYGKFLGRLPEDLFIRYNIGDTEETLLLYRFLTEYFKGIKFDWTRDHSLYFNSVRLLVGAKIRGVRVAREQLSVNHEAVTKEIQEIGEGFAKRFADPIRFVVRGRLLNEVRQRKTLKGRKRFVKRIRTSPEYYLEKVGFNVGSNKQLEALFVGQLGISAKFLTEKGAPAFRSAVLSQWGEGGLMLQKRRKRMLVQKQMGSLLELSAFDGRWHLDLRACGTATGRFSGGAH